MNRTDFHKLAETRLKEAKVLLDRKCYEGAYYLAGYAVECALKACIAKKTEAHDFPPKWQVVREFYQHDAKSLVKLAGLHLELEHRLKSVRQFESNWKHVTSWSEENDTKRISMLRMLVICIARSRALVTESLYG